MVPRKAERPAWLAFQAPSLVCRRTLGQFAARRRAKRRAGADVAARLHDASDEDDTPGAAQHSLENVFAHRAKPCLFEQSGAVG